MADEGCEKFHRPDLKLQTQEAEEGMGYQTTCASDGCVYSGIKGSFQQNWIHRACIMNNSCLVRFSLDKQSADPEDLYSEAGKGYLVVLNGIYIILY